ncbi:hypothetical protein DFJ73DRAFT_60543 [Zopfochytrium polystomum]|nr:hypothetical protein DFJ73DRAFT_60543 [Zopfochytrium polystomum]
MDPLRFPGIFDGFIRVRGRTRSYQTLGDHAWTGRGGVVDELDEVAVGGGGGAEKGFQIDQMLRGPLYPTARSLFGDFDENLSMICRTDTDELRPVVGPARSETPKLVRLNHRRRRNCAGGVRPRLSPVAKLCPFVFCEWMERWRKPGVQRGCFIHKTAINGPFSNAGCSVGGSQTYTAPSTPPSPSEAYPCCVRAPARSQSGERRRKEEMPPCKPFPPLQG